MTTTPYAPYARLETRFARLACLADAGGILNWDSQTMMPDGAAEARAEQIATLEVLRHELLTAPEVADWLDAAEAEADALENDWQHANLREMRRQHTHATAVPADLVERASKADSRGEMTWRRARADNDFAGLLPDLAEVLACQREIAAAKAEALGCSPYDALLDQYEPGFGAARVDALFAELAAALPELRGSILERQAGSPRPVMPAGPFPVERQRALGERVMRAAGFDFSRGRLDVSLHPFCGGATDDVRLTTRYDESYFTSALMGVLHETGHALYEQNRPTGWRHQPVGEARGLALHESQSLTLEMQAGRSREFIGFLAPLARSIFGGDGPAWETDNLVRLYHKVEPGFIRVDADEVTYPAHIILRTRLERAMIDGDLAVADLPAAWNEGMRELLGILPPDDRHGCLQDIHWPSGGWGYFPTYTLGALAAAQFFAAACAAKPEVKPALARGEFAPLTEWLARHVHNRGSQTTTDAILEEATGAPLGTAAFLAHLRARYLDEAG